MFDQLVVIEPVNCCFVYRRPVPGRVEVQPNGNIEYKKNINWWLVIGYEAGYLKSLGIYDTYVY